MMQESKNIETRLRDVELNVNDLNERVTNNTNVLQLHDDQIKRQEEFQATQQHVYHSLKTQMEKTNKRILIAIVIFLAFAIIYLAVA